MAKELFRGISNVCQLVNILNRQTAGGWEKKDISFNEIKNVKTYMEQRGTKGEGLPRIVCIDDTTQPERCIIEYTKSWKVAAQFSCSGIGFIGIKIEDKYVEEEGENLGPEEGLFCVSSAPIEILGIFIFTDFQNVCPILKGLLDKCKTVEYGPKATPLSPKMDMNCAKCKFKQQE